MLIYILQGSPYTNTDTLSNNIDRYKMKLQNTQFDTEKI